METRTIGLRIQLAGFDGVINSITQLETELTKAKELLRTMQIGSQEFKDLAKQISNAEGALEKLNAQARGVGIEKQLEGFGKLAGGITSTFAAATAAVSLFGGETEEVSKAAATATNLLTVALAARGVQEAAIGVKIVATTIAQKAKNAADLASVGILKNLYSVIAANPYATLATVVGLAVTAVLAFASATDEAAKAQKEFNEAIQKDIAKEVTALELLAQTIQNTNLSYKTRKDAIKQLRDIAPAYFKDLKDEEILQMNLEEAVNDVTAALIKQSTARALQSRVEETAKRILELEDKVTAAKLEQQRAEEALRDAATTRMTAGQASSAAQAGNATRSLAAAQALKDAENELAAAQGKRRQDLERIVDIQTEVDGILGKVEDDEKGITKEKEKQVFLDLRQLDLLERQKKELEDVLKTLKISQTFEPTSEAGLLTALEEQIASLESQITSLKTALSTDTDTLFENLDMMFFGLDKSVSELTKTLIENGDVFRDFFGVFAQDPIDPQFRDAILEGGDVVSRLAETINLTKEDLDELFTPEQIADLNKYFQSLNGQTRSLSDTIYTLVGQYDALAVAGKSARDLDVAIFDQLTLIRSNYLKQLEKEEQGLLQTGTAAQYLEESVTNLAVSQAKVLDPSIRLTANNLKELQDLFNAAVVSGSTGNQERIKLLEGLQKAIQDTSAATQEGIQGQIEFTQAVEETSKAVQKSYEELQKLDEEARALRDSFFDLAETGTLQQFTKALENIGLGPYDAFIYFTQRIKEFQEDGRSAAEIANLLGASFQVLGANLSTLSFKGLLDTEQIINDLKVQLQTVYPEIYALLQGTFDALGKDIKSEKLFKGLEFGLQEFQRAITGVASLVRESFSLQLQILEKEYNDTLNNIVGDTEQANAKRIELEEQYLDKKKRIEKESQLRSLQFTLAQTIASGAQAVLATLANPAIAGTPLAAVSIALTTALTTAQVALINQQIAFTKSLRRGGLLAMGGLLSGPSHENGGITYGAMGLQLEGNEAVINRQSTLNYSGLLSQINQSSGGRPIVVSSPMDSRLIEVLAKDRSQPIRAYVVEQDITRAQQIQRRLDQLATL